MICANWIECDGPVLDASKFDVAFVLSSFAEGMQRASAALTEVAKAFRVVSEAMRELSTYLPICDEVLTAMEARVQCFVELSGWGMPNFFNSWLTARLPDSVCLRFAEMIQR